ncbi:SdiA-regulated domain-containing protein [Flavobacterium sp. Arc3]|uniref:SdiA-regulated domain-containing protein n=1 Tax=Flavobacterium sp. Arc3 TaxID=3046686 RepID=UPI00352F6F10
MKNYISIVSVSFLILSCQQDSGVLSTLYSLPKKLKEVSGISYAEDTNLLWTLEDSGNANKIYSLNPEGKIENEITITNTKNRDWEDITQDNQGNLYIGDFGNNENDRKDLCIYKIDKTGLKSGSVSPAYKINFAYPEQTEFPPKKKNLVFDVESFFEYDGFFYLFTKNRSKDFDGTSSIYKIVNKAGFQKAQLIGKFTTGNDYNTDAITSAAISPDDSKVVLLSHSKIWLFEGYKKDDFLSGTVKELDLKHYSQKESISFKDNKTVFIADEKTKKMGGKVYEVNLKKLKSKT